MQQDARGTAVDAHDCGKPRLVLILVSFDLKTASSVVNAAKCLSRERYRITDVRDMSALHMCSCTHFLEVRHSQAQTMSRRSAACG